VEARRWRSTDSSNEYSTLNSDDLAHLRSLAWDENIKVELEPTSVMGFANTQCSKAHERTTK